MGIDVRRVETDEERELSVEVYDAVFPEWAIAIEDAISWERACVAQASFLAFRDGSLAGSAHVGDEGRGEAARGSVYVLGEHRGHGAGSELLRAVSAWTADCGKRALEGVAREEDADSLAWAHKRGFEEQGRDSLLVLDLAEIDEPQIEPPDGVEIVTWAERPELARGMYEVASEAYVDIPGNEDEHVPEFEMWLRQDMRGSGDRPEATFVALAGDEVVGYAKFSLTRARPAVASHDITGVKRAWRGRGVARALKAAEIAWAKRNGYERLETMNEERNEPIRRLIERFGYRAAPGRVYLRGPLVPS